MDPKTILDHLDHKSSPGQQAELEVWLEQDGANRDEYYGMKQVWALKGVRNHSGQEEIDEAFALFKSKIAGKEKRRGRLFRLAAVSAAAVVLIAAGLGIMMTGSRTLSTMDTDDVAEFVLDDGSRVFLNSASELSVPRRFAGKSTRNVTLVRGEAYFEVEKDASRPFTVDAGAVRVNVTGTSFNIKKGNVVITALESGKVVLENAAGDVLAELIPGQTAYYDTLDGGFSVETGNTSRHTLWRFGRVVFEGISLEELIAEIESMYNVSAAVRPGIDMAKKYRFVLNENEPLSEVMETLKYIAPIEYVIEGDTVTVSPKKQ